MNRNKVLGNFQDLFDQVKSITFREVYKIQEILESEVVTWGIQSSPQTKGSSKQSLSYLPIELQTVILAFTKIEK